MGKIKYKLWKFFYYKSPIYIEFKIFRPIREWWEVRKVFKRPHITKAKIEPSYYSMCHNKLFHLSFNELGYKMKYDEPRFEWNPYIKLILFNKFKYVWVFTAPIYLDNMEDMIYWESILWYSLTKDLKKAYEMNIWSRSIDDKTNPYTNLDMLKPKFKEQLLNDIRNS